MGYAMRRRRFVIRYSRVLNKSHCPDYPHHFAIGERYREAGQRDVCRPSGCAVIRGRATVAGQRMHRYDLQRRYNASEVTFPIAVLEGIASWNG